MKPQNTASLSFDIRFPSSIKFWYDFWKFICVCIQLKAEYYFQSLFTPRNTLFISDYEMAHSWSNIHFYQSISVFYQTLLNDRKELLQHDTDFLYGVPPFSIPKREQYSTTVLVDCSLFPCLVLKVGMAIENKFMNHWTYLL